MECPECKSTHINKNGHKKGKQNYICVSCGRQFIDTYESHTGYAPAVKKDCLKMYVNGMGFRAIERVSGVHNTTIMDWVKDEVVSKWKCYFYVTDGWPVYPMFIPEGDQIVSKTYMTRVEGENTRLRHYLARLKRKTLCYSKSKEMLKHSIRLLLHYLKFGDLPIPYSLNYGDRQTSTSLDR